eukprot:TRINITY_DN6370_c0_g2_i1.p1 TRINITY_DN6370_c0_g2~~TRINITY_DN6370_c0_g2_i1.p1  ORF type:complete len:263 (+),score=34.76 TRINITY_DN6370_c0_g2_i1:38-826(+)
MECGICFERFTSGGKRVPCTLPCGHTFCKHDLIQIQEQDKVKCPSCRAESTCESNAFVINYQLVSLLDEIGTNGVVGSSDPPADNIVDDRPERRHCRRHTNNVEGDDNTNRYQQRCGHNRRPFRRSDGNTSEVNSVADNNSGHRSSEGGNHRSCRRSDGVSSRGHCNRHTRTFHPRNDDNNYAANPDSVSEQYSRRCSNDRSNNRRHRSYHSNDSNERVDERRPCRRHSHKDHHQRRGCNSERRQGRNRDDTRHHQPPLQFE